MKVQRLHTVRWVILWLFTASALIAGYGVVDLLLLQQTEHFAVSTQTSSETVTNQPVVTTLPLNGILSPQWFDQLRNYAGEVALQFGGIANQLTQPLPPTRVQAADTELGNRILVQWSAPLGQTYDGVEIYRAKDPSLKQAELVQTVSAISGSWFDTAVENTTTYYYHLRSYRQVTATTQLSDWSDTVSVIPTDHTPPAPPQLVSVQTLATTDTIDANTTAGLLVQWVSQTTVDVDHYTLYRSTVAGVLGQPIVTTEASVTSARDTTVVPGVTYYYTVTASDAVGNESSTHLWSSSAGNTTPFIQPTNGS